MLSLCLVGLFVSVSEGIWRPHQHMSWNIVIGDSTHIDTSIHGDVYDVDLFDTPQSVINELHSKHKKVVCYFSAGTYESWRPDNGSFRHIHGLIGNAYPPPFDNERYVDIRNSGLHPIMRSRMDLAKSKRCDGVDADNVDIAFAGSDETGFPLSSYNQLKYNIFLATEAHSRGLAIGLKNDITQLNELVRYYDFAINESCMKHNKCFSYQPFFDARKPVFHIHYVSSHSEGYSQRQQICSSSKRPSDMNTLIKQRLDNWKLAC